MKVGDIRTVIDGLPDDAEVVIGRSDGLAEIDIELLGLRFDPTKLVIEVNVQDEWEEELDDEDWDDDDTDDDRRDDYDLDDAIRESNVVSAADIAYPDGDDPDEVSEGL